MNKRENSQKREKWMYFRFRGEKVVFCQYERRNICISLYILTEYLLSGMVKFAPDSARVFLLVYWQNTARHAHVGMSAGIFRQYTCWNMPHDVPACCIPSVTDHMASVCVFSSLVCCKTDSYCGSQFFSLANTIITGSNNFSLNAF